MPKTFGAFQTEQFMDEFQTQDDQIQDAYIEIESEADLRWATALDKWLGFCPVEVEALVAQSGMNPLLRTGDWCNVNYDDDGCYKSCAVERGEIEATDCWLHWLDWMEKQ
jgi:hypothetical protein